MTNQRDVECLRPFPIDVTAGHPNITAGTSGMRVKDASGNTYATSNNHIYADENRANIGDNALQPGFFDGGLNPDDAFGTLAAYKTLVFAASQCTDGPSDVDCNLFDAAIVRTDNLSNRTTDEGYVTPGSAVQEAYSGQRLQKCGRTTGCTKGRV